MEGDETGPKLRVPLVVDERERCVELLAALNRSDALDIQVRRLSAGDYLLDGRILFERKTILDLVRAIKSGHLFNQALRLAEVPDVVPVVILEGSPHAGLRMRRASIQGALVTVSVFIGVPVVATQNPVETSRVLVSAARQARAVATGALPRRGWRPKGKKALQNFILQGLPGVGPDRAAGLIERFGSVRSALAAAPEDWRAVPGIGVKTADKIDWAVSEPPPGYGLRAAWYSR